MATKAMLAKVLEAAEGLAQVTNRRPAAQPIGLYLMELRARAMRPFRPGACARIVTEWQSDADTAWSAPIRPARPEDTPVAVG